MSDAAKVEVAEVKILGALTRRSTGFNPKCREQQTSACDNASPECGRNSLGDGVSTKSPYEMI